MERNYSCFHEIQLEVSANISNYIPLFYVNVITYPCPNPNAGFAPGIN